MIRKLITIICLIILFSSPALTQQIWSDNHRVTFGIRAGFDMQNISGIDQSGNETNNSLTPGFNVGVTVEIPLAPSFYLKPGLLFSTKGAEKDQQRFGERVTGTLKTSYLELPVGLLYKPILGNGNLIVGFGPYFAIGVGGSADYESGGATESFDVRFQNTVETSDPDNAEYLRPMDAGANFIVGYEFENRLSFQVNAQLGLTDINPRYEELSNDETSLKNVGFGVSLGYRF